MRRTRTAMIPNVTSFCCFALQVHVQGKRDPLNARREEDEGMGEQRESEYEQGILLMDIKH